MKKSLKILSFVFIAILFGKTVQSQHCDLKPEEIPDFKKMTLIVESQSEAVNTWFTENWAFNTKIEFKTEKEILNMTKANLENRLVLGVFYEETHYTDNLGKQKDGPPLRVLAMVNLEDYKALKNRNNMNKAIVSVYTPYNEKLEEEINYSTVLMTELKPYQFKLTVKILSNLLKTIEKQQIKNYKATRFAKDQADDNCEKISSFDIFFDKALLKNQADINELKRNKKFRLTLVSEEQIAEKVDNEEDVLITYSAPYGNMGTYRYYIKSFINAKTGVIYYESGVKQIGVLPGPFFTKSNLKDIVDCLP